VKLREKNGKGGAGENGEMEGGTCGSAKRFGRERTRGAALAGCGGDGGGRSEGGGGAEDGADVAGILDAGENDEERSSAGERGCENFVERKLAWFDESGDALRMFGVSDAFEEAVGGVKDGEGDFFAVEIGSEAGVMAASGFGKENGSDAAAGRESFFGEADAFDADGAGFGGKAAAEGDAKFLEPAILAAGDDGVRSARRFAGGRHDGERSR
jgi:hypothetical protein